jgi:hypothetical protein
MKVAKVIGLIKKCYDQPLLFHILHNHLTHLLGSLNPLCEVTDEWSKILIYSAHPNRLPNQGLEAKVLAFLKKNRPPIEGKGTRLRLWIILRYLKNRPAELMNHLVIFELVTNFMGISEFTDSFILSIFSSAICSVAFGIPRNKKIRDDGVMHQLEAIARGELAPISRAILLPSYIGCDMEPPAFADLDVQHGLSSFFILESICLYAKFTKFTRHIKKIVPESLEFVGSLKEFISGEFVVEQSGGERCTLQSCVMEDMDILDRIRSSFALAVDKKAFVARIVEFVMELEH